MISLSKDLMDYIAELHKPTVVCYGSKEDAETGTAVWLAWGIIQGDKATHGNHPIKDGYEIRTSPVEDIVEEDEVQYIITRNSTYKVVGIIDYINTPFKAKDLLDSRAR